jgi:hypothetical protein
LSYRDDRQAQELQLSELEHENEKLREELRTAHEQLKEARAREREQRRNTARGTCPACGGSLLPAAVFAAHDGRDPTPLRMSTLRFGKPQGGFTHSAPVQAKVCGSCGTLQHYIDLQDAKEIPEDEPPESEE